MQSRYFSTLKTFENPSFVLISFMFNVGQLPKQALSMQARPLRLLFTFDDPELDDACRSQEALVQVLHPLYRAVKLDVEVAETQVYVIVVYKTVAIPWYRQDKLTQWNHVLML